jgi:hypothetical protein
MFYKSASLESIPFLRTFGPLIFEHYYCFIVTEEKICYCHIPRIEDGYPDLALNI